MNYLLDTAVVCEPTRPKPDARVRAWLEAREESDLCLSVLTLGEIHQGIAQLPPGARRDSLQYWADSELSRRFHGRILPVDAETAAEWGRLSGSARASGRPLPVVDALLAATAITHHLTVVTRDVADIERCGARVLNPWG